MVGEVTKLFDEIVALATVHRLISRGNGPPSNIVSFVKVVIYKVVIIAAKQLIVAWPRTAGKTKLGGSMLVRVFGSAFRCMT